MPVQCKQVIFFAFFIACVENNFIPILPRSGGRAPPAVSSFLCWLWIRPTPHISLIRYAEPAFIEHANFMGQVDTRADK